MNTLNSIIKRRYKIHTIKRQVGVSCFQLPHLMQFLPCSEKVTDSQEMYKLKFWIKKNL